MDLDGLTREAEIICSPRLKEIQEITKKNELKVLSAFRSSGIDELSLIHI